MWRAVAPSESHSRETGGCTRNWCTCSGAPAPSLPKSRWSPCKELGWGWGWGSGWGWGWGWGSGCGCGWGSGSGSGWEAVAAAGEGCLIHRAAVWVHACA